MTVQKVLAFFGAGAGLATSTAKRFAREGCKIALVARNKGDLDKRVADLAAAGVEATAFPFDLTNIEQFPNLVQAIEKHLGAIDTAVYAPIGEPVFSTAVDLTSAKVRATADLLTYAPIDLWHLLAKGMVARGKGAIVVVDGFSTVIPIAGMSGPGPAMAATANFVRTLNLELKDKGVFAGLMHITAIVERSKSYAAFASGGDTQKFPTVDPDVLAEELWRLVTVRDSVESVIPPFPQV